MIPKEVLRDFIGRKGESRTEAVNAFAAVGVPVDRYLVPALRNGTNSGTRVAFRVNSAFLLESGDPGKKVEFYARIGEIGREERRPQSSKPHRFSSWDFIHNIGTRLGIPHPLFTRVMRAIRADMALTDLTEPNPQIREEFCETANRFLDAYTTPKNSNTSPVVLSVAKQWDYSTIEGFYGTLYSNAKSQGIAIWEPYEADFIAAYYGNLRGQCSELSAFDKVALRAWIEGKLRVQACLTSSQIGVPLNYDVLSAHTKVLLSGSPLSFARSK